MEAHGAVQWLILAYNDYRNRVFNRKMGYKAFLEENMVKLSMPIILDEKATYYDLEQEAIDRDKVKHILENRRFTEENFAVDSFAEAEAIKMICKYNTIGVNETVIRAVEVPAIVNYPQSAKDGLAKLFLKYKLLSPDITTEDLILLLSTGVPSCQYMIPPFTRNVDIGLVLNILATVGALSRNWSSIICNSGMLLTSSGSKMQAKNLSAAMHKYDGYKVAYLDDRQKTIERDVKKILADVPSAVSQLKR